MEPAVPASAFGWIATSAWAYPALEALHIAGIGLLVGSLVVLELRLWGLAHEIPVRPLARVALGTTLGGFAVAAASGLLMFASAPGDLLANRAFLLKLALITLAGLNAVWFHARDGLGRLDRRARWQTVVSLGLWAAVIGCGRWIAYV
ncbi:hypothetical protein [Rubrivivax gelatinosus]|uniref:Transmembrane protein n=1 Tax=Rubrivivax gelatinosus TaxID=28068 RepID=A0A4V2SGA9_RUBGE|nr:hypothetical protein [Rubrivivax gelatinosus]MBK1687055.1 hypothetical protein [Rubrivivax gelatinosus]TCP00568.1 hypothetical protein EV684_1124 [Rubrivivax gelatinosus]